MRDAAISNRCFLLMVLVESIGFEGLLWGQRRGLPCHSPSIRNVISDFCGNIRTLHLTIYNTLTNSRGLNWTELNCCRADTHTSAWGETLNCSRTHLQTGTNWSCTCTHAHTLMLGKTLNCFPTNIHIRTHLQTVPNWSSFHLCLYTHIHSLALGECQDCVCVHSHCLLLCPHNGIATVLTHITFLPHTDTVDDTFGYC